MELLWVLCDREDVPVPMGPNFHPQGDDVGSWWVDWRGCPYPLRDTMRHPWAPVQDLASLDWNPCTSGARLMRWTEAFTDDVVSMVRQPSHTGACLWEGGRQHCRPGVSRSEFPAPNLAASHPHSLVKVIQFSFCWVQYSCLSQMLASGLRSALHPLPCPLRWWISHPWPSLSEATYLHQTPLGHCSGHHQCPALDPSSHCFQHNEGISCCPLLLHGPFPGCQSVLH